MKVIRELFIFYFFIFYVYFYFSVDEEFMVFIVIFIWLIFFMTFYLKTLQDFFKDNIFLLVDEYFFFHNKRNLFLSIIRDQFYDVILLNNFINLFFLNLISKINKRLIIKIIDFYKKGKIFIKERLNFFKLNLKIFFISNYLTAFIFFYKIVFFLLLNQNICFNFFFIRAFEFKKQFELKNANIEQGFLNLYSKYYKKTWIKSFMLTRALILDGIFNYKFNTAIDIKKKRILKSYKIFLLIFLLRKTIIDKKLRINPTRWFYLKKLPVK